MLSSISKPPDQISKLQALARVKAAIVTLIGNMIYAPARHTNTNISWYNISFDRPRQGIDIPFPSFKGDILVEVKRNIPGWDFLETKRCKVLSTSNLDWPQLCWFSAGLWLHRTSLCGRASYMVDLVPGQKCFHSITASECNENKCFWWLRKDLAKA